MRQVALSEPATSSSAGIRVMTRGIGSFLSEEALEGDGGFGGPTCAVAQLEMASSAARLRLTTEAADYAALAEGLAGHGIRWGEKWLAYADTDRWTFAVEGPDGTIGRYHRNVDLIADVDSHFTVVRRDPAGQPTGIEIHVAHEPTESVREWAWEEPASDVAVSLAHRAHLYADPEADPPRLTRTDLADRVAAGLPLPPPSAGIDLVTGELLPGTVEDRQQVLENFFYGVSEDSYALLALRGKKAKSIGWEIRKDFSEYDGIEEEPEPDAAARP